MCQRIEILRKDRKLRQKDIAMLLRCSQVCYSRYERGERSLPVTALVILADFYGVSTDYLLGRTDQQEPFLEKSIVLFE